MQDCMKDKNPTLGWGGGIPYRMYLFSPGKVPKTKPVSVMSRIQVHPKCYYRFIKKLQAEKVF